jgi:RecB family endonuclease NucS
VTIADLASKRGWVLHCNAKVYYDGRANSILDTGDYLIVYKEDGSVSVHGNTNIMPRNYMGGDGVCTFKDNILYFESKNETIKVEINNVLWVQNIAGLSQHKPIMVKTEKDLVNSLIRNISSIFNNMEFVNIATEFQSSAGPIDLCCATSDSLYVIEVKRKKAGLSAVSQLQRYVQAAATTGKTIYGYLAAPEITKSALKLLESHSFIWIEVGFDDSENNKRWPNWCGSGRLDSSQETGN